jgi:hypothetical protein
MKIISVSVWGENPRYGKGAVINARLAEQIFPEWRYRIYFGSSVPTKYKNELLTLPNVDLIEIDESVSGYGMFWRFNSAFLSSDTVMISRDCDSRLSEREKRCVEEWLTSDKRFSIIRDHPRHFDFPVLGGMWGLKGMLPQQCFDSMKQYEKNNQYAIDQFWLQNEVYPLIKNSCMIHEIGKDDWFSLERKQEDPVFVGQGYDENNVPIYPSWD